MTKIPYKVRVGISVGLFIWSIGAVIASICFSQMGLLWTAYVGPILAFLAFILSVVFMPKTNEDGTPIVIEKKRKEVFVSQPSWNYDDDDDDDDDDWEDEEEDEEEERRCKEEEEDEEEFMMYYEGDD